MWYPKLLILRKFNKLPKGLQEWFDKIELTKKDFYKGDVIFYLADRSNPNPAIILPSDVYTVSYDQSMSTIDIIHEMLKIAEEHNKVLGKCL